MSHAEVIQLLDELSVLDVRLWYEGERLRYDAPSGILTSDHLAQLKRLKPEILAYLQKLEPPGALPAIVPVPRTQALPLSYSQERMWFLHEFQQDERARATYNMTGALRLRGRLDVSALRDALDAIVRRHEVLRTRYFARPDGTLAQRVEVPAGLELPIEDLTHLDPEQAEAEFQRRSRIEALHPFQLAEDPLLRVALFRLSPTSSMLLINMHHMVSDGWSLGVLFRELSALYKAFSAGEADPLSPLPIQYADYAVWQRTHLVGPRLEQQLEFWRKHLDKVPRLLELPTDFPRPSLQSYRGALVRLQLTEDLTRELGAFSRRHRATSFMVLLAVYGLLLSRYAGVESLAIGVPVANRRPSTESLIGLFMNTVVMPVIIDNDVGFLDLLGSVRDFAMAAQAHQDVPFEQLVEVLHPERSLSHTPLFQAMFIMQNTPVGKLDLGELQAEIVEVERMTAKFDLTLSIEEQGDRLEGWLEYNSDLFAASTARSMVDHFQVLLANALANPNRSLRELRYLTPAEYEQLRALRGPCSAVPEHECVHRLFAEQAARTPERTALVFEGDTLTYAELERRANQLANHLRALGVGHETLVALHCRRSNDMVVAMLAVLKTGGTYLPLDTSMPPARIEQILTDSGAKFVISTAPAQLAASTAMLIDLRRDHDEISTRATTAPIEQARGSTAAYIIYTSGSTGVPKGVVVEHRNVCNFFRAMDLVLDHEVGDSTDPGTWLALTTFSFDISVLELLWTLTRGFRVIVQGDRSSYFASSSPSTKRADSRMDFSLMYFASHDGQAPGPDKYRLLFEGAKFADQHDFTAVWMPERHFHDFGEIFPNPSLLAAALALQTKHVQLRAGSVVLPLHHPLRVVEEWAVVDNISNGRVALSLASGWHADDFVLAPDSYETRKQLLERGVEHVRSLWRGQPLTLPNGMGKATTVQTRPRPVQPEVELWVTAAGTPSTFELAGRLGANVLTHLLGQSIEDVEEKLRVYRRARQEHGHDPNTGKVTLMVHTFVGEDLDEVREVVRQPMKEYLGSSLNLLSGLAQSVGIDLSSGTLSPADLDVLVSHAFERYFATSALFGTVERCVEMVERLSAIGVTEVACLIDFGLPTDTVLSSLELLNRVRERCSSPADDSFDIAQQIQRYSVTHLQATPSLARMLLSDERSRAALGGLRAMCVGGEELPLRLAQDLGEVLAQGCLYNMYGPTETTIWSTWSPVRPGAQQVTIGTPLLNTRVHILDEQMMPVPRWVPGEIYIGGAGVARAYHRRPELSAQRFIDHEHEPGATQRLYRTGDLGRLQDGEIVFLGRNDNQVKVRGFRIELGEIEAKLAELPGVTQCVVTVYTEADGEKRLIAHVTADPNKATTPEQLRKALARQLPEYMLPSHVRIVDYLPQTPNGKIDRKALSAMTDWKALAPRPLAAPHTITELRLLHIWQTLLGLDAVSISDNFFELGGHSLLAVRLLSLVEREFGHRLPLATLFHSPTIEALARTLELGVPQSSGSLVKIREGRDDAPPLFLIPGAGGNVLYFYDLSRAIDTEAPIYGIQATHTGTDIDPGSLVDELALRYIHEIKLIQPHGPYRLVGHSFGGWVAYEMALRLAESGDALSLLGVLDSPAPVDVQQPTGYDWDSAKWVYVLAGVVERLYGQPLGLDEDELRKLDKAGQLAHLDERMHALGVRPPGLSPEQLATFFEVFRADQLALYSPRAVYPHRISVFRAIESNPDNARGPELLPILADPQLGWTSFSRVPIEVWNVPGDHLSMMRQPHVGDVAAAITKCLERN